MNTLGNVGGRKWWVDMIKHTLHKYMKIYKHTLKIFSYFKGECELSTSSSLHFLTAGAGYPAASHSCYHDIPTSQARSQDKPFLTALSVPAIRSITNSPPPLTYASL